MRLCTNFVGILFAGVAVIVCAAPRSLQAFTSPGVPVGFVNDYADILSAEQEADLESVLKTYEQNSANEVAVVTVSSTGEETIESYAVQLFQEWGIGKRGQYTGVLMLVAAHDRQVRIEVGYGLEPLLTDAESQRIIQRATQFFQQGRYYEAVSQMAFEVESVLSSHEDAGIAASLQKSSFEVWTDQFIDGLPPGIGALLLIVATVFFLATGRFILGFILACLAYLITYIFSLLTHRPRPVFRRFLAGAFSGLFSGILSGVFRSGGFGGGGSSGGGFGGGRSGGGGSSGSW